MAQRVQFQVTPEQSKDEDFLERRIRTELKLEEIPFHFKWARRSIDARKRQIKINASFDVYIDDH